MRISPNFAKDQRRQLSENLLVQRKKEEDSPVMKGMLLWRQKRSRIQFQSSAAITSRKLSMLQGVQLQFMIFTNSRSSARSLILSMLRNRQAVLRPHVQELIGQRTPQVSSMLQLVGTMTTFMTEVNESIKKCMINESTQIQTHMKN